MRIAQIAPPWVSVPPVGYGGVERIVSQLTEELVKRGHEVTLFASGDSQTNAKLSSYYPTALGNDGNKKSSPYTMLFHALPAFQHADRFDIIHCHDLYHALFLTDFIQTPVIHTIHGATMKQDQPVDRREVYEYFPHQSFVSISYAQQKGLPQLHYVGTVYNGVDISQFSMGKGNGGYLVWMGRITPKKGIVEAITVAKHIKKSLWIAARIDPVDQPFFDRFVKPKIDGTSVRWLGELPDKEKTVLLQNALALLYPIRWYEPFGLVMAEAMACGTPVIATRFGSTPEIIEDGKTGYLVDGTPWNVSTPLSEWREDIISIAQMEKALETLVSLDRTAYQMMKHAARKRIEEHFTVRHMVDGYEQVYKKTITGHVRNSNYG